MHGAGRRWVMVNCTGDTLTDTASGGIANWVLGVVEAAARAGTIVPVITKRHPGVPAAWAHAIELSYPQPSFKGSGRVDNLVRRRTRYVHRWQPLWNRRVLGALADVAPDPCDLLFHNDPELAAVVAHALPRHRVWHLLHNTNPMDEYWKPRFVAGVRPLAISDFIARWAERHLAAPPGVVRTVYAGVDSALFAPGHKPVPPVVSYVGLLNERKAPDLLLAACELVLSRGAPPFAVRVIGAKHYGRAEDDDYTTALQDAASRLGRGGVQVTFSGFLPRAALARELAESSIHVVPSRWEEPFSLAALEGMSAGAATVVSDRGGLPEAAGEAAVVVPGEDVGALAEALGRLLEDAEARSDLARRGRERAVEMSWDRTWASLISTDLQVTRA